VVSGLSSCLLVAWLGLPGVVRAGGKPIKECKPHAPAVELAIGGAVEVTQPLEYQNQRWVLVQDKLVKPDKIRLVAASGDVIELGKPPSTVEPTQYMGRGQAFYAVGTARSQTEGKRDVIVLRWGRDPRPRLTTLWTVDAVDGKPRAAIRDEHMVALFSRPGADGKPHVMAGAVELEEMRIAPLTDLGERKPDGFFDVLALPKGFGASFEGSGGFMRASFDNHGKSAGPASALQWPGASSVRALWSCGERLWLLHDAGKELALTVCNDQGAVVELARLPSAKPEALPALCTQDGLLLAHRTANAKDNTVVLSIATIDGHGKLRDRPVRDIKGSLDDVREPQLVGSPEQPSAFWVEGRATEAKVWSRELVCE
jgi:hypothetical protein